MKERFEGANQPHLIAALCRQDLTSGNSQIAEAIANYGQLVEFERSDELIVQNGTDNDVYLLLSGTVAIVVNGAQVGIRNAGQHVGEMAAIEPSLPRSATVRALENVVALKINGTSLLEIGEQFPKIWRPLAQELSRRLYQRNTTIMIPNTAPKLFIISSSEARNVAHALRDGLKHDVFSKVWDDGVFFAGGYPLEALENEVAQADFAVAIAEPDDVVHSRNTNAPTMRDNVLFELGLFMGKLTRYRAVLMHPKIENLKLPSDFQGLTVIPYDSGDPSTVAKRLTSVCDQIKELVKRLGVRTFTIEKSR